MSTKEEFERAWIFQFSSSADDTSPPLPSLSCWDGTGSLRSQEALRDELESCRQRIADLKRKLRAEEFVEFYCQQELDRLSSSVSRAVCQRSFSAPYTTNNADALESPETSVQAEGLYSEPVDSRIPGSTHPDRARSPSPEGLYSVPVNATGLGRIQSDPEPVYASPADSQPITPSKRVQRRVYEEINDVRAEKVDGGSNSSDDESVENLVAIRQSVSRLSQWFVDGDAARRKLEVQAKRLSSRFTNVVPSTGSTLKNNILESVPESLLSPVTPSGMNFDAVRRIFASIAS